VAQAIGIVVIGRNEGQRLRRCLAALPMNGCWVVYVDSASTDGSPQLAAAAGAHVVALDMSVPFTAARARNAGLRALLELAPETEFVQFLDGDCEMQRGWLRQAVRFLAAHPAHAVACGRVREREPQRSVFNRLCQWEWDAPAGEAAACGGNAMMRVPAFLQVGGFREQLIAGEEPELCVRLRRAGWGVHRLDAEMVLHDAAITRFSQWWRRTMRSGHAFAEGAWMHGLAREHHWLRETLRALFYGGAVPIGCAVLAAAVGPAALLLLLLYPLQVLCLRNIQGGWTRAFYLVLGRFPECLGAMKFLLSRLRRMPPHLIEYK
jgi:GT2 family glycosyltransferase